MVVAAYAEASSNINACSVSEWERVFNLFVKFVCTGQVILEQAFGGCLWLTEFLHYFFSWCRLGEGPDAKMHIRYSASMASFVHMQALY